MVKKDLGPVPAVMRIAALALVALLLCSQPLPTAAAPLRDRPPNYEVEPLPEWTPPRDVPGMENQVIVYHAEGGTTDYFPLPAAVNMPAAALVPCARSL